MKIDLPSWPDLQKVVINFNEKQCLEFLEAEKAGQCRRMYMLRLHSRFNKVRAHRERAELIKLAR